MAIRKGNKHQLDLFFLLEACQRNAAGWSTTVWPANAIIIKLPLPHGRSSISRPCCSIERSSAKLLVFTCTSKFERSTSSESVDALGLRAVEVIICMITRDFSVISMTSQASLSLSLSLPLTKVTDAQYRKRGSASYNIYIYRPADLCLWSGARRQGRMLRAKSSRRNFVWERSSVLVHACSFTFVFEFVTDRTCQGLAFAFDCQHWTTGQKI